jgi:four helix bundle protein
MNQFESQLMERLENYALRIIAVYSALPEYPTSGYQVAQVLGKQLLRSGTSVGANYAEAVRSHSLADKAAKQQICIKELEETAYWLRLLIKIKLIPEQQLTPILMETGELTAIFVASVRKLTSDSRRK